MLLSASTLAWKTPLLFVGYPGPGRTVVAHFWDGLGPVGVYTAQLWDFRDVNQQVPSLLQRTRELCSLEMLNEVQGGSTQGCVLAGSEKFQPLPFPSQPSPPPQKSSSSLPPMGLLALVLSHPVDSKHHESKSSLYP